MHGIVKRLNFKLYCGTYFCELFFLVITLIDLFGNRVLMSSGKGPSPHSPFQFLLTGVHVYLRLKIYLRTHLTLCKMSFWSRAEDEGLIHQES